MVIKHVINGNHDIAIQLRFTAYYQFSIISFIHILLLQLMATGEIGVNGAHAQKAVALVYKIELELVTVQKPTTVAKFALLTTQVIQKPECATRRVVQVR